MDLVRFTRELVDIPSVTGDEPAVGEFLEQRLCELRFQVSRMPVSGHRFNLVAVPRDGNCPSVFLSTHMDTVPPFIASSEDDERIYGRGACDAKGIVAAQVAAAIRLRDESIPVGLLFVVGEERGSDGAQMANQHARACRFLIDGEPTENRLGLASKGSLQVELVSRGKAAHSAYPELGDSAIEKLLQALDRIRAWQLPQEQGIGASTMNIGIIEGGRAPNVISDHARAELLIRLVGSSDDLKGKLLSAADGLAEVNFGLEVPFMRLRTLDGFPTMVAAFTTDIPVLRNWGQPLLLGPGSIHVAHTEREYVSKQELSEAVDLYAELVKRLLQGKQ